MAIQRLVDAIKVGKRSRFLVMFGPGIDDIYFPYPGAEFSLEQALWSHLKNDGYTRVVFFSPTRQVYYYDEESRQLSRPPQKSSSGVIEGYEPAPKTMHRLRDGVYGSYNVLAQPETINGYQGLVQEQVMTQTEPGRPSTSSMGDTHAIRLLNSVMADAQVKSAVIFVQSETLLRYFEDQRTMAGLVGGWARLPSDNPNRCFFLFSTLTNKDLDEILRRLSIPELRGLVKQGEKKSGQIRSVLIGGPEKDELERMLDTLQGSSGLQINDQDLSQLIPWIQAEGATARHWQDLFMASGMVSLQSANENGWLSGSVIPGGRAIERLQSLIGLESVKQRIAELEAWLRYQKEKNQPGSHPLLHMVFLGNPGTGKTTVARLLGEILRDLGYLKRGHLIETTTADLVAGYVGQTTDKTNKIIDTALDGVLFIDEAYSLAETGRGGYGQEAIDALLVRLENDRQRLVVIAAGYPVKMEAFLKSNPGLARRFPEENRFLFPDYTPVELSQIFTNMLSERGLELAPEMAEVSGRLITTMYQHRTEDFGNAGEIRNLVDGIERRNATRQAQNPEEPDPLVRLVDLPESWQTYLQPDADTLDSILNDLDQLVGLNQVKALIHRQVRLLLLDQTRRSQGNGRSSRLQSLHMVFSGNPGTGKTTVARLMGRILRSLGLLQKGHVVEAGRSDLVAGFVGQTAIKTEEKIKAALDGILFIDEAYSLARGGSNDFGQEAIDALVKAMEDQRGRLVIILAGYPREMVQLIGSNPGLSSRINLRLDFKDYTDTELVRILGQMIEREGYSADEGVYLKAGTYFRELRVKEKSHFGNGRAARNLFLEMEGRLAERYFADGVLTSRPEGDSLPESFRFVEADIP